MRYEVRLNSECWPRWLAAIVCSKLSALRLSWVDELQGLKPWQLSSMWSFLPDAWNSSANLRIDSMLNKSNCTHSTATQDWWTYRRSLCAVADGARKFWTPNLKLGAYFNYYSYYPSMGRLSSLGLEEECGVEFLERSIQRAPCTNYEVWGLGKYPGRSRVSELCKPWGWPLCVTKLIEKVAIAMHSNIAPINLSSNCVAHNKI